MIKARIRPYFAPLGLQLREVTPQHIEDFYQSILADDCTTNTVMVHVKLTGEVCEVSRETMRVLRNEEKKLRRSKTGVPIAGCKDEDETATLLSLDFVSVQDAEEMSPAWLEDPNDLEETVLISVMEQEFRLLLSERQLEVYHYCLLGGMSMTDYSKARGIDVSTVFEAKRDVQKKAKIFFKETPKN